MEPTEKSSQNIPYGGWGRVQPTYGEVYGSGQSGALPYGMPSRTQGTYSDWYGAGVVDTLTTANFVTGFIVGVLGVLAVGWYLRRSDTAQPQ